MIVIDFSFNSNYGIYSDAILLPDDHVLTEEDIELMKEQRFNSWIISIETAHEYAIDIGPQEPVDG